MTVNSTATLELNISEVCLEAYRTAGLKNVYDTLDTQEAAHARSKLELVVDSSQTQGIIARSQSFYLLPLTADEDLYTMPASTMSIIGDAMYQAAAETDTEHPDSESRVVQRSLDEWHLTASKDDDSTGVPSEFVVLRETAPLQVRFWQTPSEAGKVRFRIQRLLADNNDGTKTPDIERAGVRWLVYAVAHELALAANLDMSKVAYLRSYTKELLREYRAVANEQGDRQWYFEHQTPWS